MIATSFSAFATFAPQPVSNRDARRFLRAFLADKGLHGDVADTAELALSEVVTNAVLHAATEFDVVLQLDEQVLRVEVTDRNPQLPVQRRYADQARRDPWPVPPFPEPPAPSPCAAPVRRSPTGRRRCRGCPQKYP